VGITFSDSRDRRLVSGTGCSIVPWHGGTVCDGRRDAARAGAVYASKRRKIVTAFWPPNPNPLTATVSTFAFRATSGT